MNTESEIQSTMKNKGTGAGGANTNLYGKKFEEKTDNQPRLLDVGYIKIRFTQKPNKTNKIFDYYFLSSSCNCH